ncbi:BgiBsFReD29 [Biomphalaria glabrata]|nr:BgiBsFReD29 [Biomphalaria glabrata]
MTMSGRHFDVEACFRVSVKDDLKITKQNIESVKDDLKITKQNIESVKDDLKMTKQNIESVKDDLKMTKQNIESVKDDLKMTKQNIESVKDDLKMTKQNIESVKDDLKMTKQNIESDIESVKENFKSSQEIIRRWTQTIYLLSANLSEFQSNVTKLINEGKTNYTFLDEPITSLLPESCRDVISTKDRVVVTLASGLKVMCDTKTDGGGWIIFQRRINGKVDFYRGWKEYRDGFGDYNIGEFYLGNENIFKLTSTKNYDLRIDLEFDNKKYYARYTHFDIWGEEDYYKLEINGYSGNAGDSLKYHNDTFFSTYDKDIMTSNCASHFTGAWWYKDCFFSNLNGYWESNYLNWNTLSRNTSVTFTEMKIREVDLN